MFNFLCFPFRLQPTVPLALNSKDEVEMFFNGKLPKLAKTATDIAVVGMFMDEKEKGNFQMVSLILSLPESVMETFKMVLSFEPVDKIIWCDLVNSTFT